MTGSRVLISGCVVDTDLEVSQMIDFYEAASRAFQESLSLIEKTGRKGTEEWHLTNGLLQLAKGLRADREAEEELRRGFARTFGPSPILHVSR